MCFNKSDTHVLLCDFARTVWVGTGLQHPAQASSNGTAFAVLHNAFKAGSRSQCVLIGMLCCSIWNRRKKWVWDKANGSVFGVVAEATNFLHKIMDRIVAPKELLVQEDGAETTRGIRAANYLTVRRNKVLRSINSAHIHRISIKTLCRGSSWI